MSIFNKPIILSDNFYDDVVLHPNHIISTSGTEIAGSEVFNIADNLRDITQFTVAETNVDVSITVNCGSAKSADLIILDRGHNLKASVFELRGSTDGFISSNVLVGSFTIPASPSGLATDANGCVTTEGVWWKNFTPASFQYWKVVSKALGAGVSPIITGLYLGLSYRFPEYMDGPAAYDYRLRHQVLKNSLSQRGVRIKRRILNFSEIDLKIQLEDVDFSAFNVQARQLMIYNHPWWFCLDDSQNSGGTDLMRLFQLGTDTTFDPVVDPVHRSAAFLLEEVIPINTM